MSTAPRQPAALAPIVAMLIIAAGCATGSQPAGEPRSGRPTASPAVVRGPACPSVAPTPAPGTSPSLAPAQEAKLTDSASRLDSYATQHFPESYAGVALSTVDDGLLVYRKPLATFDAWIVDTFPGVCVVLVDALHSQRELFALQARVDADNEYWRGRGVRINTTSPRVDGSAVEVGTLDVAKAKQEFPGRYGVDAPIAIVPEGPVS